MAPLPPPPIATNRRTQNQIRLLWERARTPAHASLPRVFLCVCLRAWTGCTYCAAETAWLKTNWQKTFGAEKKRKTEKKKKSTNTTTCQEQNASNFSVIWQPFNKTRSLCPHTPSPSRERRRWREAGRLRAKRQTEHQMCLFLISDLNSLNLASLSRLWVFALLAWTSRLCTSANGRTSCILRRRANGYLTVSQAPEHCLE